MNLGEYILNTDVRQSSIIDSARINSSMTTARESGNNKGISTPLHKRLVICCDGTLNDSIYSKRPPTNVTRLARCILDRTDDGVAQTIYYQSGVGTVAGGRVSRAIDAATGRGKSMSLLIYPNS